MQISKLEKNKFFLLMLKNLSFLDDFNSMLMKSMKELKIDIKYKKRIETNFLPDGLMSLMMEMNNLINRIVINKKKPKKFSIFRTNEKVKYYILQRLEVMDNLKVPKKKIFFLMIRPSSAKYLKKILFNVADEIWFHSGDKSTDFNYYTKRLILMKIYASTFTRFVFDNSFEIKKTRVFLDNQIALTLTFGKFKSKIKNFFSSVQ